MNIRSQFSKIHIKNILLHRKIEVLVKVLEKLNIPKDTSYKIFSKLINNNNSQKNNYYLESLSPDPKSSSIINSRNITSKFDLQIIVPAYNAENTIDECINSILSQQVNYQILLTIINDGSTDKTQEKVQRLISQNSNKNIKIKLINQVNKGFSGARNSGLNTLCSKYVMFVDSDDTLVFNSLDKFLQIAFSTDADIIEGGYYKFFNKNKWLGIDHNLKENANPFKMLYGYPWGKLYRSSLWKNTQFPDKYWFEDTVTMYRIYPFASKVITSSNMLYNYRINPNGITFKSSTNIKSLDSFYITRQLLKDCKNANISFSQDLYDFTLGQFIMNDSRLRNFNIKIREYVFNLSCDLLQEYFPNSKTSEPKLIPIEEALRNKNYAKFFIYSI